jgi:hypothetical protein
MRRVECAYIKAGPAYELQHDIHEDETGFSKPTSRASSNDGIRMTFERQHAFVVPRSESSNLIDGALKDAPASTVQHDTPPVLALR